MLALTSIWLNDAADPSDKMAFDYAGDAYTLTRSVGGGVEGGYASGRLRSWSTAEEKTTGQITLHALTDAQRAWLVAHLRRTVAFRDHLGSKVFVRFTEVPQSLSTLPVGHAAADNNVTLGLTEVTWSEEVG